MQETSQKPSLELKVVRVAVFQLAIRICGASSHKSEQRDWDMALQQSPPQHLKVRPGQMLIKEPASSGQRRIGGGGISSLMITDGKYSRP